MDAKLDSIVGEFKARLDELLPQGSREKSLAQTNIEQAQLWAERARNLQSGAIFLHLYSKPEEVGWLGWMEGDQGRGVEFWVGLDNQVIPNSRFFPEDPTPGAPPASGVLR